VRSLAHLVELLRDLKEDYVTLRFDQRSGETLVFNRQAIEAAMEEILRDNDVRAQGSADMLAVWERKTTP
jgi:hypothetical protein